ncbi:MAG: hypothetical protein MJE12_08555 [Alphaproteobacteria bacterium]|nr:hypothetical protein [Alphaproteobacteria bacterium]
MFPHIIFGVIGAATAAFAVSCLARRWNRHPAAGLGTAAVVLFGIIYIASLQLLVLYVDPQSTALSAARAETVYLAYAGVGAAISVLVALGLMAGLIRLIAPRPATDTNGKPGLKIAIISVLIALGAAPFLVQNQLTIGRAIAANEAEITALRTSYTAGLERLVKLGIVKKIAVNEDAVTHYVTAPLYELGARGLAEYAKASLIYHIYVTNGEPKPIVIRDADTGREIGTYHADGVFLLAADAQTPGQAPTD